MFYLRCNNLKLFSNFIRSPVMCGQQNRKMSVQDTIEELTQIGIELRRNLHSAKDKAEKVQLVLKHIKQHSETSPQINDFQKGLEWFNVTEGLSLCQHLNGKITILDFFTYCCINCMHILPDLDALEKKYTPEDGLVVVGVHSAKFANERNSEKILSAVQRYNINHPVVNDAKLSMWRDIGIVCWPSMVILGPKGQPLFVLVGEGHKDELFLYTQVCLDHFKSLGQISNRSIPIKSAQHLLPATKDVLLFPGKVETYKLDDNLKLIISDTGNNRILIASSDGKVEFVIGGYSPGFKDGSFEEARFNAPQGACYYNGNIYVADNENHAIRRIDLTNKSVSTIAGTGSQGQDYSGGNSGTNQPLSSPWDVKIYLQRKDNKEVPVILIAIAGTHQIWAYFLEDTIWWNNKQYKKGTCSAIVGNGREANRNNSYPHAASLAQPSGLAVAQEFDTVYFADSESSSIRKVYMSDGKVAASCGADKNPTNLHDFGDVDGKQFNAKLQHPLGVVWDSINKLVYIADTYNHKIKQVDIEGNCKSLYGLGKPGSDFQFNEPSGLALSLDSEVLYVTDTNNHEIKIIHMKNKSIQKMSIQLPAQESTTLSKDKTYLFNTIVSSNGGLINIIFDFIFQDTSIKLNKEAPQKWKLISVPKALSPTHLEGDVTSPISLTIPQGNDPMVLNVILNLVTCGEECKVVNLSVVFNVKRSQNAPKSVDLKEEIQVV